MSDRGSSVEPILNSNLLTLKESATLAINERVKQLRRDGKEIVHWGFGQSPFPVHDTIKNALIEASHHKEYLPTLGLYELRETFCEYYRWLHGYEFDPDCVLVGPGSKELIFQILFALEGPLIIPAPSWVSYGPQAHIRGKNVFAVQTRKETGYKLTPDLLEDACKNLMVNRQKILIINSPNNPTGTVYSAEETKLLSAVCRKHNVIVISDEIYALTDFSGKVNKGFSECYPEGTIVTTGLSKGHSAGGYRLGLIAMPRNFKSVLKALMAMVSETFSAVSAPTQYAAVKAYSKDTSLMAYVKKCTEIHQATGMYLFERFQKMGLGCVKPEGAFYLFPDFDKYMDYFRSRGIVTSPDLCNFLLKELSVATLPGSDFYFLPDHLACRVASVDYDGEKVVSAANKTDNLDFQFVEHHCPNLKKGCDKLQDFLKSL